MRRQTVLPQKRDALVARFLEGTALLQSFTLHKDWLVRVQSRTILQGLLFEKLPSCGVDERRVLFFFAVLPAIKSYIPLDFNQCFPLGSRNYPVTKLTASESREADIQRLLDAQAQTFFQMVRSPLLAAELVESHRYFIIGDRGHECLKLAFLLAEAHEYDRSRIYCEEYLRLDESKYPDRYRDNFPLAEELRTRVCTRDPSAVEEFLEYQCHLALQRLGLAQ